MITAKPFNTDNPLAEPSALPFQAPPFDRIGDDDYLPAIEEGMRRHHAEVEAIASQSAPATFGNTIVALERSGDLLNRALKAFFGVTGTNTNDVLQDVHADIAPKLAAHSDEIFLDARLYARVEAIRSARPSLGLDPEASHLVDRYYTDFVHAGARLDDAGKTRLRELNQEESRLTAEFQNRLLAANKAGALVFDDAGELAGLPESELAAAAQTAADRGLAGKWVLTLHNTTQQPVLESLERRDVRKRVFEASRHRADHDGPTDMRAIVVRLCELRAERAVLLGFTNAAEYTLEDQMAKTPDAAIRLLNDIATTAVARAHAEAEKIQATIDADGGGFTLEPWDWQFYAERVRRAEYALDEAAIKPYFALDRVVHDGVFHAATLLYGLRFHERRDIPVYHPDVRTYEVFDADESSVALFYTDFYKRDNKNGGAWMDTFVDQSRLLALKPVVINVTNLTKPANGEPALLSFDEVTTLFHEFGHALHAILSNVEYPILSGTSVPRDFVEFPSQFNEHWALDPAVFANYACHHRTGEPMPAQLVEKIKKSRRFNQGFALTEYTAAALLDMSWHTQRPGARVADVSAFEAAALAKHQVDVREVPPRYSSTYFAHIWDGGYGAGYYAYLWAEVQDHDAFAWFKEHGGLTRANGDVFREKILSRGGTRDSAELYREFRGRDPVVAPLLDARGLSADSIAP